MPQVDPQERTVRPIQRPTRPTAANSVERMSCGASAITRLLSGGVNRASGSKPISRTASVANASLPRRAREAVAEEHLGREVAYLFAFRPAGNRGPEEILYVSVREERVTAEDAATEMAGYPSVADEQQVARMFRTSILSGDSTGIVADRSTHTLWMWDWGLPNGAGILNAGILYRRGLLMVSFSSTSADRNSDFAIEAVGNLLRSIKIDPRLQFDH